MMRVPRSGSPGRAFGARLGSILALLLSANCGARTGLELDTTVDMSAQRKPKCGPGGRVCVLSQGACEAPTSVAAACDEATGTWSCPSGTRPYARAPSATAPCLPFRHAQGIDSITAWGVAGLARIPIDDGRCLWVANHVMLSGQKSALNIAFEPAHDAPFGSCPDESMIPPTPIVTLERGDQRSLSFGWRHQGAVSLVSHRRDFDLRAERARQRARALRSANAANRGAESGAATTV